MNNAECNQIFAENLARESHSCGKHTLLSRGVFRGSQKIRAVMLVIFLASPARTQACNAISKRRTLNHSSKMLERRWRHEVVRIEMKGGTGDNGFKSQASMK